MHSGRIGRAAAIGLVGLAIEPGCDRAAPGPSAPPAPATQAAAATPKLDGRRVYTLQGVVRAVDRAEGEVTIAHEAMPGFMGAMVMPFQIKDKAVLDDVRPGDIVHGPMVVQFRAGNIKDYELTDLTVTGTEPPPAEPPAPARPRPLAVGAMVPDFALTTQEGATLHLADLRGKVVALTFIYTRCPLPDFCPAVDAKFADLARRLTASPRRADRVALLSVSFDPAHDTPAVLKAHADRRGARPPWTFAVATPEELARVGPLLGLDYYPEKEQFAHNLATAVVDPDGRLARLELGRGWTPADLAKAMIALIRPTTKP